MVPQPPDLPAPVGRFLRRALSSERRIVEVTLDQSGRLRIDPRRPRWLAFTATHRARPEEIRFAWDARVRLAPGVRLRVLDTLARGQGATALRLGPLPLRRTAASPEVNAGALHRFLAEAAWYPSALRPSARLAWTPVDSTRAVATLTGHGTTVALEFRFTSDGDIVGIYTPARWGRFAAGFRQVPWEGRFGAWAERDGVRIPLEAEVGWHFYGTWHEDWQGQVNSVRFRFEGLGDGRTAG